MWNEILTPSIQNRANTRQLISIHKAENMIAPLGLSSGDSPFDEETKKLYILVHEAWGLAGMPGKDQVSRVALQMDFGTVIPIFRLAISHPHVKHHPLSRIFVSSGINKLAALATSPLERDP